MTDTPSMPSLIGRRLGDHLIEAVIGRGGMATVYRARDQRLGRAVALKILAPQLSHDERFRERFVRESRLVASLDHPNIIPIYEAGEREDLLFIAMRYVEGSDLRKLVQATGQLPVARANPLFAQIAAALDAAHAGGLVHRDVKPANILVAQGDHVYLTDFGLTKSSAAEAGLTSHGHFMGTPRYVAPEQIRGLAVDGRSDLYAFACVVYEALAGQPPFQRDTELALLYAHVSHDPPPLTPYRPDLPHAVNPVLARALAKNPAERYATCREFVSALRDAISGGEQPAAGPAGGQPYPQWQPQTLPQQPYRPQQPHQPNQAQPSAQSYPGAQPYPPVFSGPTSHPSQPSHPSNPSHPSQPSQPPVSHPGQPVEAGGGRRLPLGPLIGGLAVLVSIAVAATLILTKGGDTSAPWNTYPGSTAAPFTMAYPSTWGEARTNADQWMIASPAVGEFDALFAVPGNTDWSKVNPVIANRPERAVGVFAQVSNTLSTSDSPTELQESLQSSLPGTVGYTGAPMPTTVGGRPAFRLDGVLGDPAQTGAPGGRLDFSAYLVREGQDGMTTLITFFCARCERQLIDHMINTVAFTG